MASTEISITGQIQDLKEKINGEGVGRWTSPILDLLQAVHNGLHERLDEFDDETPTNDQVEELIDDLKSEDDDIRKELNDLDQKVDELNDSIDTVETLAVLVESRVDRLHQWNMGLSFVCGCTFTIAAVTLFLYLAGK